MREDGGARKVPPSEYRNTRHRNYAHEHTRSMVHKHEHAENEYLFVIESYENGVLRNGETSSYHVTHHH